MGNRNRLLRRKSERKVGNIIAKLRHKEKQFCEICHIEIPKSQKEVFCLTNAHMDYFYFFCSQEHETKYRLINGINAKKP
jgi:hypothetical protein